MDCDEIDVPPKKMAKLDDNETKSGWVMPALEKSTLERLLNDTATVCTKSPRSLQNRMSQNCFPDLNISFGKILNNDAINDWEPHVHDDVKAKCKKLVELCVYKMDEDLITVLEALALVLDPKNKFQTFNAARMSESVPAGGDIPDGKIYARPLADPNNPRGWLVDLLNKFGDFGGFVILLSRFQPGRFSLTIRMIYALLRPFGLCHELLTVDTIAKYFIPIIERVPVIFDALTDDDLREEAEITSIHHVGLVIIKDMNNLVSRAPEQVEIKKKLELLKLQFIGRIETFINFDESMAKLGSNIQLEPQDHLEKYFYTSWKTDNDKSRVSELETIHQLVTDSTDSARVPQILTAIWNSALSDDVSTKVMEKALNIHVDILTHFRPYYCDTHLIEFLDKCVDKLKSDDKWALPALQQMQKICEIYDMIDIHLPISGDDVIRHLDEKHGVATLIINSFTNYMEKVRQLVKNDPTLDMTLLKLDGRYDHVMQVRKRLEALTCLSKIGMLPIEIDQVKQIWLCLVEQPIFVSDRELGFDLLFELMETYPVFKSKSGVKDFFEQHILQFDEKLLTHNGIEFFDYIFELVNGRSPYNKYNVDNLIGVDYLWQVVINSSEKVSDVAFFRLKLLNKSVGLQINRPVSEIHRVFIAECTTRLQVFSNILTRHAEVRDIEGDDRRKKKIARQTGNMSQLMRLLQEYMNECGWGKI